MACATSVVKYLLFLFNLLCALVGIAFIAIGVVFKLEIDDYTEKLEDIDSSFSLAPTLLIVLGCIVFVISFMGCCGALKENSCLLTSYAIILLTLLILQVGLGVYAFIEYNEDQTEFKDKVKSNLLKVFGKYYKPSEEGAKEFVDTLQYGLECCGVESYTEWSIGGIPSSCCKDKPSVCAPNSAFNQGCYKKLWSFMQDSVEIVGIVVLSIGATELIAAIIALCLSSSLRNDRRRYYS